MNSFDTLDSLVDFLAPRPCIGKLAAKYQQHSRYVSQQEFYSLEKLNVRFAPYNDYSEIYLSPVTNRLYAGNINDAGHGVRFEVRPITIDDVEEGKYILSLYEDWAIELGRNIDASADYVV